MSVPEEQPGDGGLARARVPDDGRGGAWGHVEAHVLQALPRAKNTDSHKKTHVTSTAEEEMDEPLK
jgi:hypothetical protein